MSSIKVIERESANAAADSPDVAVKMHRTLVEFRVSTGNLRTSWQLVSGGQEQLSVKRSSATTSMPKSLAHLATCMMSQVIPFDIESTMIKRMDHLVDERILHVFLVEEPILAKHDAVVGRESTGSCWWTWVALNGIAVEGASGEVEMFEHENHGGALKLKRKQGDDFQP